MSDPQRARSDPSGAWDRARRAYVALLADRDPASSLLAAGAADCRLGFAGTIPDAPTVLVSGPDDLRELREIVESALGVGTWPARACPDGAAITARVEIDRPAAVLGLLIAMEGLIEARSPWGRWRSVVDTMAARLARLETLTIDVRVIESAF
jgi:hypothetical protein